MTMRYTESEVLLSFLAWIFSEASLSRPMAKRSSSDLGRGWALCSCKVSELSSTNDVIHVLRSVFSSEKVGAPVCASVDITRSGRKGR